MHISSTLLAILAVSVPLAAQVPWTRMTPGPGPTARSNYDMVWALHEQRAVLFAGESATGYLSDTWSWDGTRWTLLKPVTVPPRRAAHKMSYDLIRKETTLFSGWNGGSYIPDTWVWNGTDWKQAAPTTQPPPRDWHGMAYDISTLKTVLFGGHDFRRHANNGPGAYGDTWTWDGANWTQITPNSDPGKRFGHTMAFDKHTGDVVMLGGATPGKQYDDMWRWNGTDWVQLQPATLPGHRLFASMEFDDARNVLVLTGGQAGGNVLDDTWEWDGTNWKKVSPGTGPNVSFADLVYDPAMQEMILFGGAIGNSRKTPADLTWHYGTKTVATYSLFGTGCQGTAGTPALTATNPVLGKTFTVTAQNLGATSAAFVILGLSDQTWGSIPLPLDLGTIGATGCKLHVDMLLQFGMTNSAGTGTWASPIPNSSALDGIRFFNQVWTVDGTAPGGFVVSNAGAAKTGQR